MIARQGNRKSEGSEDDVDDAEWAEVSVQSGKAKDVIHSDVHHGDDGEDASNSINSKSKIEDKRVSSGDDDNRDKTCEGLLIQKSEVHNEKYNKNINESKNKVWASKLGSQEAMPRERNPATITQHEAGASGTVDKDVLQSAVAIAASLAPWASKAVSRALGKAKSSQPPPSSSPSSPATSHQTTATPVQISPNKPNTSVARTSEHPSIVDNPKQPNPQAIVIEGERDSDAVDANESGSVPLTDINDEGGERDDNHDDQSNTVIRVDDDDEMDEIDLRRQLGRQIRDSEHVSPEMVEEVR